MRVKEIIIILCSITIFTACSSNKELSEINNKTKKELSKDSKQQYYYVFIEANRKKLLGDLNGALALYYQCLEIFPESAAASQEISKINEILNNYSTAIKYAIAAVEKDPENKWYRINLAKLYIITKEYNKAVEVYENLYKISKEDLEIPYNLAALQIHLGNYKRAIELYDEIEKRVGVNENLALAKQQLYYKLGNKTMAYNEINKLIKHYPKEPRYYGIIAEMYTQDNLYIKAEENYNKLFQLDSNNTLGQLSIIDFYRKKMDYDKAFKSINEVLNNNNIEYNQKVMIFVSLLNNQGEFNIYNQKLKELLILFKKMYPDNKDSYTLYADYLIKMNQLDEAKIEIEYILERFKGNIILWEQLLSIYSFNNDFKNLYIKSKTALDSFPNHTLFYLFNGVSANQTGKSDEAIEILKKGLNIVQNNEELELDFYTNLGEAYYKNKDYRQSDYYFEKVLKKEPNNLYVINNYSYYLSLREEKLEYAESISKRTIEAEPNNSTYLDTYAWILFKLKRYQDALLFIKKAYENGGLKSQVIVEHYGDIQFKVGNTEEAVELWKLSGELGNNSEKILKKIKNRSIN
ncbi:tetratricopeptide repeat protein [Bacteroidota bacterium]